MRERNQSNRGFSLRRMAGFTLIEMLIVIGVILLLTAITVTVVTGLSSRAEIRDAENTMRLMKNALSEWELGNSRQVTYGIDDEPCGIDGQEERYELPQLLSAGVTDAPDTDALRESDMLWSILSRASSSREIIARINPDFLIELTPPCIDPDVPEPPLHFALDNLDHLDSDGFMDCRVGYRFLDPWGNPIIAVMPGRGSNPRCSDDSYCSPDMTPIGSPPNVHCPDDDGTIRTPFENRFGIAASKRIFFVSAGPDGQFGDLHLATARDNLSVADKEDIARAADNIYSHEIILEEGRPEL